METHGILSDHILSGQDSSTATGRGIIFSIMEADPRTWKLRRALKRAQLVRRRHFSEMPPPPVPEHTTTTLGGTSAGCSSAGASGETVTVYEHEVGARLRCEWRNGELRDVEILERRVVEGRSQYYVHYADFNRRLDEWVSAERLHVVVKSENRGGNERKRKVDPAVAGKPAVAHNPHDEAAAGELDAATQKEHEEATRVKNVNTRCLARKSRPGTTRHSPPRTPTARRSTSANMICTSRSGATRCSATSTGASSSTHQAMRSTGSNNISVFEVDVAACARLLPEPMPAREALPRPQDPLLRRRPFLFYVLTEWDDDGCHPVGYFSKRR